MNQLELKDGFVWSLVERFGIQTIQFIANIIIARIILPEDYGLIGMMAIFIGIGQIVVDSGLSLALIQKKSISTIDISTMFFTNIVVGVLLYVFFFLLAPFIGAFYNQPVLNDITKIISLSFIFNSFGLVQKTLFTREIQFKPLAFSGIVSATISGVFGIILAYYGFRVWALVYMYLLNSVLLNSFYWILSKWKPKFIFSVTSFKELFSFGINILASGLLNTIFQNVYYTAIGRYFPTAQLGYYTQANRIQLLPVQNLTNSIQRVAFSHFSKVQNENERFLDSFRKILKGTMFLTFPLMFFIIVDSPFFVPLLLTDKWIKAVPYLQLLSIVGMFYPLHALNLSVINAKGKSKLFLKLEFAKKLLIVINILITVKISITAMIYGQIIISALAFFINAYFPGKFLNYKITRQLFDIFPSLLISVITYLFIYYLTPLVTSSNLAAVIIHVVGFTGIYLLIAYLSKREEISFIKQIINFN